MLYYMYVLGQKPYTDDSHLSTGQIQQPRPYRQAGEEKKLHLMGTQCHI